ncbi:MAG TPA: ABC transporter permease [Planctomycetaceae bacterium]|jgi:putative ABC transport system permease protein|nr:ABC transporter permease [Planctomycetaceae bacterium]
MLFVEVIAKNLLRRKLRTLLTIGGLAAAVATSTALLSSAWSFAASSAAYYSSRGVDVVVVRAGVAERITSSLSASLADRLRELPEVGAAEGSLTEMVSLGERALIGIPMHGVDPQGLTMKQLDVVRGRALTATDRRTVLLGSALADGLKKQPGETLEIERTTFQIAGVFQTGDAIESNTVLAPLADVQELMGRPGQVSEFQIRAASGGGDHVDIAQLCRDIEALRDSSGRSFGFKALPTQQFVNTDTETRLTSAMAWGTSVVAIGLSLVAMLNTMLMSVLERTKEFGVLRAVGWSRGRVIRMILGESLAIGLFASLVGMLGAGLFVRALGTWSYTRNFVHPSLSAQAILLGIVLTLFAGLAGSFYPAYRGATCAPLSALHFE